MIISAVMLSFPGDFPNFISFNAASTSDSRMSFPVSSLVSSKSSMSPVSSKRSPIYSVQRSRMSCCSMTTVPSFFFSAVLAGLHDLLDILLIFEYICCMFLFSRSSSSSHCSSIHFSLAFLHSACILRFSSLYIVAFLFLTNLLFFIISIISSFIHFCFLSRAFGGMICCAECMSASSMCFQSSSAVVLFWYSLESCSKRFFTSTA